jgi:dTDP-glucose 4,6-dehydratase
MPKTLLVTGAAGFIGTNFMHYWASRYPEDRLVAFDALTYAGNRVNLAALEERGACTFIHGDITDARAVAKALQTYQVDTIVHFAAESHVDRSITGPGAFIQTNVVGTYTLLEAARQYWLAGSGQPHRFHHVSTDEVFGSLGSDDPPFTELLRYEPNSPYSASKAASDHLVRAYHHTYGLEVTTSNCSNNYGPYHFPEKLIPLCITNLLEGKALPVYGDGRNIRDWLYVEDHARGIDAVLARGELGETYNIGGCNEWSNLAIVEHLCDALDARFSADESLARRFPKMPLVGGEASRSRIRFVTDRPGHDWRYAIDASKIAAELDFTPQETFESGIAKTLDWYLDNESWWRPLLARC